MDKRTVKLAKIIVNYSTKIKKGDNVLILSTSPLGRPLAVEIAKLCIDKGAHVTVNYRTPEISEYFLKHANEEQLKHLSEWSKKQAEETDVRIMIDAPENLAQTKNCPDRNKQLSAMSMAPILPIISKKRWLIVNHPTTALAQEAGMSLSEYEDFVYDACLRNWPRLAKIQSDMIKVFENAKTVSVRGPGIDMHFRLDNRTWLQSDGTNNMPGGEVFTSPSDANGKIYIDLPTYYNGKEFRGIELQFKNGKVVSHNSSTNLQSLTSILNTDPGAKNIAELAFGTNFGVKQVTGNTLFDEKIGGTMHIAIGRGFSEAGGDDSCSVVHWDMVRTLKGCTVKVGRVVVVKKGKWVI
ncbi:aminopeptidase [Candidatus Woesearchaeota archaeon]|nr:MAG: aminopeptidase [Candidatus Woesearchaeota archaeon]